MMQALAELLHVPTSVVWAVLALAVAQVAAQVWALIDLARRPRVRYAKKWVWALVIIVFGNSFIGPLIYAVIGRQPGEPDEAEHSVAPASEDRTARAVATLYGDAAEDTAAAAERAHAP